MPKELIYRTRDGKDELYLVRRMLLPRNRWFNVYLHQFLASDAEGLHDHPWDALVIGLRGWYWEDTFHGVKQRRAGRVRIMVAEKFHRVIVPADQVGKVWTLLVRFPRRKAWGFLPSGAEEMYELYGEGR